MVEHTIAAIEALEDVTRLRRFAASARPGSGQAR